ncbi:TPA: sensor histidine kinase [Enterococcus faecalis]
MFNPSVIPYLFIYTLYMVLINFIDFYIFFKKKKPSLRFVNTWIIGAVLLTFFIFIRIVPQSLIGFAFLCINFFSLLFDKYPFIYASIATQLNYYSFYIFWYFTFYLHHIFFGTSKFPYVRVDWWVFWLLLSLNFCGHILFWCLINWLNNKYDIHYLTKTFENKLFYNISVNIFLFFSCAFSYIIFHVDKDLVNFLSTLLLLLFFTFFISMGIFLGNIVAKKNMNQALIEEYNKQLSMISSENENLHMLKHDYKNILLSLSLFAEKNELESFKKYCSEILEIDNKKNLPTTSFYALSNILELPLQSLLYEKFFYANEQNIDVEITILETVYPISNVPIYELIRCIGILVDNAIEACLQAPDPFIQLSIFPSKKGVTFTIKNTKNPNEFISVNKIFQKGYSTKGKGRGLGLYALEKMVYSWGNATINFSVDKVVTVSLDISY